jgi:hypothetical protein
MTMEDVWVEVFCLPDDELRAMHGGRLRQRGHQSSLADSEVRTSEEVGEALGLEKDIAISPFVLRDHGRELPKWASMPCTTGERLATNWWSGKPRRRWRDRRSHDSAGWLGDG